jgi:hypothetical protein
MHFAESLPSGTFKSNSAFVVRPSSSQKGLSQWLSMTWILWVGRSCPSPGTSNGPSLLLVSRWISVNFVRPPITIWGSPYWILLPAPLLHKCYSDQHHSLSSSFTIHKNPSPFQSYYPRRPTWHRWHDTCLFRNYKELLKTRWRSYLKHRC